MSTFDKIKAQEDRRAAIKRQMEAMEAAADPRSHSFRTHISSAQSSTTRRRSGDSRDSRDNNGNIETARRFLGDEDEDENVLLHDHRHPQGQGSDRRSTFVTGQGQGESIWSSMKSSFNMFGSGTGKVQPATLGKNPRLAEINLMGESRQDCDFDVDEEGPAYRPSICTSIYISIRRLILGLALAAGGTYQYTRSRWEMAMSNGRGKKLFAAIILIAAIVIPTTIVLTKDNEDSNEDSNSSSSLSTEQRHSFISQRILDSGMSHPQELMKQGTPQNLALEWIATGDHAQLAQDHDYLLQRYSLAVFFYSTHGDFIHPPSGANLTDIEQTAADGHDNVTAEEKKVLDQPDWINQNRWMSSYGICAWHGVQCHHRPGTDPLENTFDDEGDVIVLNMTDNNVRGTIPRELFIANPYIRWLSFSGGGIFGELPTEIGYLDDLRYLSLSDNEIGGSLPSEIAKMTSLNLLFLDANNLVGPIPPGIGELTELAEVSVYDNFLTGTIPTEFGLLQKLESLYLDVNNFFGTLPSELGAITHLDDLRLRQNHFIGTIPTEFANLEQLEILYLDRNELTGTIPPVLGGLKFLSELHIYGNKLVGPIPPELADLRALASLYVDNNHLTGGVPTQFGAMINLEELYIHKNYLNGTLPTEIGKMSNLRNFRAYTNGLIGKIPDEIGGAWKLDHLYLHDNLMTGTIPESIKEMTRLEKLRLYWNGFEGTVPTGICDLMEFKLSEFMADCSGDTPSVTCSCCTGCYD